MRDDSQESYTLFMVFLDESGECWWFRQDEVRLQGNYTLGRPSPAMPERKSGS
jgi:hypothetical protein